MKLIQKTFLLVILLSASLTIFAAKKPLILIQHWRTTTGTPVYFVQAKEIPMLDVRMVFSAGSAYDEKNWGLAALVNNMLGEGTSSQSADQIAEKFDDVGAQFSHGVGRDITSVHLRSLSTAKYLDPALNEFIQVISQADFPEKAIKRVKNQTLVAIKQRQQSPDSIASLHFFKAIYANQPYAHPVIGDVNSVNALTKTQLEHFYKQAYCTANANIILVGDISQQQAKSIANRLAAVFPKGKKAIKLAISEQQYGSTQHINFPTKQTAIVIGELGITRKNSNYFPLMVGNAILGGLPFISQLFQQIRVKRGLTYDVSSSFSPLRYRGVFSVGLKTKTSDTTLAVKLAKKIIKQFIEQGPTEQQLKAAKQSMIGSFPLSLASNKNILRIVTNLAFYNQPLTFLDTYRKRVAAVTINQIKQAFSKALSLKKLVVITVGPKSKS